MPLVRENWVLSLRGQADTILSDDAVVPFYLLPSLGGSDTLRGYPSWRFRDRHAALTTAEFRWIPNRNIVDVALFYDAGMVAPEFDDLSLQPLQQRRRHRRPFPRAVQHAAAHRAGEEPRRPAPGLRRERGLLTMPRLTMGRRPARRRSAWPARPSPSLLAGAGPQGAAPRFFHDDPLMREPETQDASKVEPWDIDLAIDLATNLFSRPGDKTPDVRAQNVNTIDEVPDSSWFTNRIGARPLSIEEAVRGPLRSNGPGPRAGR